MAKRIYYIDVLRTFACLAVILIHASAIYVIRDVGSFNFCVANILDGLARFAVPIFIMISGALMLDENYHHTSKKMIKHIGKLILVFVFWSSLYSVVFSIIIPTVLRNEDINMSLVLIRFIQGHYHLWFIYLIIGMYLIVPLLRLWVKDKNKTYVKYYLILAFVFTFILPQIMNLLVNKHEVFYNMNHIINNQISMKYVGGYVSYFVLGWYLHNNEIKQVKLIYLLGVLGFCISIFGTYWLSVNSGYAVYYYDELSVNVLLQTIAIFVFAKTNYTDNKVNNKLVEFISKHSLGIYLTHALAVDLLIIIIDKYGQNIALINIIIIFILVTIISTLMSYSFSKLPLLKRVV